MDKNEEMTGSGIEKGTSEHEPGKLVGIGLRLFSFRKKTEFKILA